MPTSRYELATRLESLLTDFRFAAGRDARRSDGVVDVWIQYDQEEDGSQEHLITIFAGLPEPRLVRGLPWTIRRASDGEVARVGLTNGRGQFHVRDLEPGDYTLDIEVAETLVWPPEVMPQWKSRPTALKVTRPQDEQPSLPSPKELVAFTSFKALPEADRHQFSGELVSCKSETMIARLHLTANDHLILEAELRGDLAADRVAQVRVWDEENRPLAEGYLGLYPIENGQAARGETRLDLLSASLRDLLSRGCLCHFSVASQSRRGSSTLDQQVLEKSLAAVVQPASRRVLEAALGAPPERWRDQASSAAEP
jgi:hypothetical protein